MNDVKLLNHPVHVQCKDPFSKSGRGHSQPGSIEWRSGYIVGERPKAYRVRFFRGEEHVAKWYRKYQVKL